MKIYTICLIKLFTVLSVTALLAQRNPQLPAKWANPPNLYGGYAYPIAVVQMDSDPQLEIVVYSGPPASQLPASRGRGRIIVIDASTGEIKGETPRHDLIREKSVLVVDIDKDGKYEIIFGGVDRGTNRSQVNIYGFSPLTTNPPGNNSTPSVTERFSLKQNYPNPFNPETTIEYAVQKAEKVNIKIYNSLGQLVRTLINEKKTVGEHSLIWDGKNNSGAKVASGTYFYQLQVGDEYQSTKKMILLK